MARVQLEGQDWGMAEPNGVHALRTTNWCDPSIEGLR